MGYSTQDQAVLFERKLKELKVEYTEQQILDLGNASYPDNSPKITSAVRIYGLRTLLQDKILESVLNLIIFLDGENNVFQFQRDIITFIETGFIPEYWQNVPNSFFRHSGKGWDGDIALLIPRSLRKTTLFAKIFVWFYLKDMDSKNLLTHNDLDLCSKNLSLIQDTILNEELALVFPDRLKFSKGEYRNAGGRITRYYLRLTDKNEHPSLFGHSKEGNFEATSTNQDLASQHFTRAWGDDVVIAETSKNEKETQKVSDYVDSLNPLAVNLNKGMQLLWTGTAWYEKSYHEYLKTREAPITYIQLPAAWGVIDESEFIYEHYLCEELLGAKGLKLNYEKTKYKPFFWSQFFMICIPIGGDSTPLTTRDDFIKSPLDFPSEIDTHNTICIDPISREGETKRAKSKGAVVQVSVKDACAYVKMGWTFTAVPDVSKLVEQICEYVVQHHIDCIIVEKVHAQRWLLQLIRKALFDKKISGVALLMHDHKTGKFDHIYIESGLQGMFDTTAVYVNANDRELIEQIKGNKPFGDELDALAFYPSEVKNWQFLRPPKRSVKLTSVVKKLFKGTPY